MVYDFNSLTKQADEASNRDKFYTDFEDVDPNVLHQISELTNWMRTKAKGSDVREVIAQLFERTWLEESKEGNANMEVAKARGHFPVLNDRLNNADRERAENTAQLAQKANKDEVTNVITPKGTSAYASLPMTGNSVGWYYYCPDGDGIHGAGNYVWDGTSWFFGGTGDEGYNLLKKDLGNKNYELSFIDGKYINKDNGIVYEDVNYSCTDYLEISPCIEYILKTAQFSDNSGYALYDKYHKYISGDNIATSEGYATKTIVIPKNAKYIRISCLKVKTSNASLKIGRVYNSLSNISDSISENIEPNIIDVSSVSKVINGIYAHVNKDGTITFNGTATDDVYFHLRENKRITEYSLNSGNYKIVGCPNGGSSSTYYLNIACSKDGISFTNDLYDCGSGSTFSLNENHKYITFLICIRKDQVVNNLTFKPMLTRNLNATFDDYIKCDMFEENEICWSNDVKPPYWIFHLDCGRKYFSLENMITILDSMEGSFNQFNFHFSEDGGFRFSLDDMNIVDEDGNSYDLSQCLGGNENNNSYYNQNFVDNLIYQAKLRNIDIVPSFDMPGHMNWILRKFPQFSYQNSGTLDITNPTAVKFALAIVDKYSKYFSSKGCKYWNIGFDEIVGSTGFETFYNNGEYHYIVDFANKVIDLLLDNGLTPRIFNEAILYRVDYRTMISKKAEILYWFHSSEFANVDYLQNAGYKLINTNANYYWIMGNESKSISYYENLDLLVDFYGYQKSTYNGYGAMLCAWCDQALINDGDNGNDATSKLVPIINAFKKSIEKAMS